MNFDNLEDAEAYIGFFFFVSLPTMNTFLSRQRKWSVRKAVTAFETKVKLNYKEHLLFSKYVKTCSYAIAQILELKDYFFRARGVYNMLQQCLAY